MKIGIENSLLGFGHEITVRAEDGTELFVCKSEAGLLEHGWSVQARGREVARVSTSLGIKRNWSVDGSLGTFKIQERLLGFTKVFDVVGGWHSGAVLRGSLLDRSFELTRHGAVIAKICDTLFSLKDHQSVEVSGREEGALLLTVICMVCVHSEHMKGRVG